MYKILKNLSNRFKNSEGVKCIEFNNPYVSNTFDNELVEIELYDVDCFSIEVNNVPILIVNDIDEISIIESKNKTTIQYKECTTEIVWG